MLDLQNKLPRARVVYASATGGLTHTKVMFIHVIRSDKVLLNVSYFVLPAPGASEPKNMIYMSRLGIWGDGTPFRTFDDFLHAIEKRFVKLHSKASRMSTVSCSYTSANGYPYGENTLQQICGNVRFTFD